MEPISFEFLNLQDDVGAMIDANSTQVVEYMYDHLAKVNRSHETKNEKLHPFPVLLKNKLDFKLQLSK